MSSLARFAPIALIAALGLTGAVAANGSNASEPLLETSWQLAMLGDTPVDDAIFTSLIIGADGSVGGNGGCNSYGGSVTFDGETGIDISEVFSTMMYCGDAQMAQERDYFAALENAVGYALDGTELTLLGEDEAVLAVLTAQ